MNYKFGYVCYINTQQHINCVGRFDVYNFANCSSHLDLLFSNYCSKYAVHVHFSYWIVIKQQLISIYYQVIAIEYEDILESTSSCTYVTNSITSKAN